MEGHRQASIEKFISGNPGRRNRKIFSLFLGGHEGRLLGSDFPGTFELIRQFAYLLPMTILGNAAFHASFCVVQNRRSLGAGGAPSAK